MANNKERIAFGIFKDGLKIRIARLAILNGAVNVQKLEETILSSVLYKQEEFTPIDTGDGEIEVPELIEMDEDSMSVPEIPEEKNSKDVNGATKDEMLPGLRDLQNFLQQFSLERGKISFSANDEQVSYFKFDPAYGTRNLQKRLLKELLTKEEIKSNLYSFDYILYPDKSGIAFVHKGKFRIFHALRDINLILSKERYFYHHIETNEVALINLVNYNYEFPEDEYVLILYIGFDYKIGIVMQNRKHVKTFPIIVPEDDDVSTRKTIFSKLLLEQDVSNIQITKNIILAGDNATDEDIEYYRSAAHEGSTISKLKLEKLSIQEGMEGSIGVNKIAEFAIPIELAWKTLDPKNKYFSSTNLLPHKVIENQKYFKIAWHGFLILDGIFYFAFAGTIKNLELKQDLLDYGKKNYKVERDLSRNRALINRLNEIKARMAELEANLAKVEKITGNKNQWHHILDVFSSSLYNNRLSWLSDVSSNDKGFTIDGYTTNRRAIIEISKLFPDNRISSVAKNDKVDETIWRFNISYTYPDPKTWREPEEAVEEETTETIKEEITKSEPEPKIITVPNEAINAEYNSIITLYFEGSIEEALQQFTDFVEAYPDYYLSYNAKYFIGECLYLLNRFGAAKQALKEVYDLNGNKSPDALIMLGNCSERENDYTAAIQYWTILIDEYPDNELSKAARYKINKLKGK